MLISEKIQRKNDLKEYTDESEKIADMLLELKQEQKRLGRTKTRDKKIRSLQRRQDEISRIVQGRAHCIGLIRLKKGETLC